MTSRVNGSCRSSSSSHFRSNEGRSAGGSSRTDSSGDLIAASRANRARNDAGRQKAVRCMAEGRRADQVFSTRYREMRREHDAPGVFSRVGSVLIEGTREYLRYRGVSPYKPIDIVVDDALRRMGLPVPPIPSSSGGSAASASSTSSTRDSSGVTTTSSGHGAATATAICVVDPASRTARA